MIIYVYHLINSRSSSADIIGIKMIPTDSALWFVNGQGQGQIMVVLQISKLIQRDLTI